MFPSEVKILTVVSNSNSNNNNNSNKDNCNTINQDSIKNLKYTTNINKNNCLQNINNTNKQQQHKNNNAGSGGGGGGGVGGVHRRKLNSYQNRKKFHQNNNNNNNNNNNCLNKNHNNSIINTNNTNNNNKHVINNNNNDRIIKTCSISRSLSTIKQQNRKNLEQISITTNSIPLTNTSMVMNNNKSKTQQQQQQQLITTTTTSSTTVTSSSSSSQSSQPAIVVAATANSSSSSSSYSIDFLHSVRFQMTAGTNRSNYTPSSSSSSPSPSRHTQFLNNGSQQQHHHHHHHHHHHCVYDDANLIVSTTQQQQQQQQQQQHQQHQQNLNTSNQGKSSNFIVGGGGGGGNINPATRNNNNNNSNSTTTTTTTLPPPNNVQFVYQNSHGGGGSGGGYPTNPTYLNHNNFHNHHIIQYRSTNTNQPFTHNNNNNNNTNHNNRNSYHNHNNNNIPMKNWAWNPPNSIKKSHHINNMNVNKLGSISTGNLDSNSCSSNCNPLQQQQRTRNHQNHNNLTYISADSDGKIIGNSRSPTPSPKSESPSLYKQQSLQVLNKLPIVTNDLLVEHGTLMAAQISSSPSSDGTTISSVTTTTINNNNNNNNNNINNNNLGSTLTGYESDSSHSSYRHSDYIYHPKNFTSSSQSAHIQLGDISSLGNFQTFSTDDDHHHHQQQQQQQYHHHHNNNHHPAQQHHSNYGSHQNLTFWNSSANLSYSPHSTYSSGSGGSSEAGTSQYLSDGNVSTKRSHYYNRTYRGRRHLPSSFRANGFHESLYTPPDRFLARSHLIEIKQSPPNLLEGSKWDQLSQTVWDKFLISQQTEETYRKKMYLWRYLYVTIKKAYPRYGLYLVGSTISGFGADTSDVDMCLVTRNTTTMETRMEAVVMLTQLKEYLTSLNVFEQFHLIEAKVPILRFKDSMHMLEVDLNFNNCVGIHNTHLLHCYSKLDWRLRPLVLVIKLWAQFHDINNAKNMTISSYSLVLMVIHFLQFAVSPPVLPCLHDMFPEKFQILLKSNDFGFVDMNEECGPYLSQNTQPLGELFLQFLEYYSSFDYTQYAISVRTGTILPIEICRQAKSLKNDIHQWKQLCIEEPFDLTNTARSVYDGEIFERVKAVFIASWKLLNETMDINSIFSPIITTSMSQVPFNSTIS